MSKPLVITRADDAVVPRWDISRAGLHLGTLYRCQGRRLVTGHPVLGFTADDHRDLADRMERIERGETPL